MQKIYTFLTACLLLSTATYQSSAQGYVGIGTETPEQKLEIEGVDDQFVRIHTTSYGVSSAGLEFLRGTEFLGTDWKIVNEGGTLKFYDALDNFMTPGDLNLTLTNSGNLGLGISSPEARLHIVGSESISETGEGYSQIGSPSGLHLRFDANEILARNGDNASPLYLQYWSGNLYLCEDDAGRVGIGNGSPQAKLHITDGTDVTLAGGGQLVMGSIAGPNLAMDGNEIQARDNGAGSPLFLQISAGDVLMVPNETGQVGIGVTSSATMPSNDYLLAVDGKIISEEVRVEISGSWPDYVFDKDYKLAPLNELEKSIITNGHLPGIPSAEEIENDGILLGDMQKRMMEKIEELTLYVIALQKEIEAMKEERR